MKHQILKMAQQLLDLYSQLDAKGSVEQRWSEWEDVEAGGGASCRDEFYACTFQCHPRDANCQERCWEQRDACERRDIFT